MLELLIMLLLNQNQLNLKNFNCIIRYYFWLLISTGLVLIRVFLRRGIESPEQLEELGINVYASVPVAETFMKNNVSKPNKLKSKDNDINSLLAIDNPQIWQ
jgi:tyrosine-protein kinase Etk/Wzc